MNPEEIINLAIGNGLIEPGLLRKVQVTPIQDCLTKEEIKRIDKFREKFEPNKCLMNSYIVQEQLKLNCCEGVAYIIGNDGIGQDWIKHCWNVKHTADGDKYFDVGMEYAYTGNRRSQETTYFLLHEYKHSDYKKLFKKDKRGGFLSKAPEIKDILRNQLNELLYG